MARIVSGSPWDVFYLTCLFSATPSVLSVTDENPRFFYSLALAVGALLSGVIGELLGLRATFWLSVPFIVMSIIALLKFREPMLHKTQAKVSLISHTKQTFQAVIQRGSLVWIILPGLLFAVLARLIDNLGSLWYLGFRLPVIFWGPAYALLMMSFGFAGPVANFVKNSRFKIITVAMFISLMSLVLTSDVSVVAMILAQTVLLTGYGVLGILLSHYFHDSLPSNVRAGASSTGATLAQIAFLPVAYVFGRLSDSYSIFWAAWLVVGITLVGAIVFCFKVMPRKNAFPADHQDIVEVEAYLR